MSRPLHKSSFDRTSPNGAIPLLMVYLCECGTKWNSATKAAWDCKCGRPLVKRNGIIHAAIGQPSGEMASYPDGLRTAAERGAPPVGNRYPQAGGIRVPLQKTI